MNAYSRAYRDPKSPLAPLTPRCTSSEFSFHINSDSKMPGYSKRKSLCNDYSCSSRSVSCSSNACTDYSCSKAKSNCCTSYYNSPCSSRYNGTAVKRKPMEHSSYYAKSSCSLSSSCCNLSSRSCASMGCSDCDNSSVYCSKTGMKKSQVPHFRSFIEMYRNPYQCRDCGSNVNKENSPSFACSGDSYTRNRSNSVVNNSSVSSNKSSKSNSYARKSKSSKLSSNSTAINDNGSEISIQVPDISTFIKKCNISKKSHEAKNIKVENSRLMDPQMSHLLQKNGLAKYKNLFQREEIDCLALSLIKEEDFKQLDVDEKDVPALLDLVDHVKSFYSNYF